MDKQAALFIGGPLHKQIRELSTVADEYHYPVFKQPGLEDTPPELMIDTQYRTYRRAVISLADDTKRATNCIWICDNISVKAALLLIFSNTPQVGIEE